MLNYGKTDEGTRINCGQCTIIIHPDSITTGTITVRDNKGTIIWLKSNQSAEGLIEAIVVAKIGVQTNIVE